MSEQPASIVTHDVSGHPGDGSAGAPSLLLVPRVRPKLRGVNHAIAFPLSLLATIALTWYADGARGRTAALIFGLGVTMMFGTSGAYHRIPWPDHLATWARRVDHSFIFITMAAIYTSVYVSQLRGGGVTTPLLIVAWVGAALGIAYKLAWIDAPKHYGAMIYIAFGLTALGALPTLIAAVGGLAVAMLVTSNIFTLTGALVYTFEWPDPIPHMFGFHEIFHLCVTLSVIMQFAIMATWFVR